MQRTHWFWPALLLLSALVAEAVYAPLSGIALRPLIMLWFLAVCPGMALVRFLHVRGRITLWTLAVAVSLALDTLVSSIQLYTGHWSPTLTFSILLGICSIGALVQMIFPHLVLNQVEQLEMH